VRRWSLGAKILAASGGLILTLVGATLTYVSLQANALVAERLTADLASSAAAIRAAESDRFDALQLTVQVIEAFPQLRALLEVTDAATIRDVLKDYLQRTSRAHLLIVVGPSGETLARTDAVAQLAVPDVRTRWIDPLLAGQAPRGYVATDSAMYQAAAGTADAGGTVFGVLIAGARVDAAFAGQLRTATGEEIVILTDSGLLGSTLPPDRLPWSTAADWRREATGGERVVNIEGENYAAVALQGADPSITYLVLQSRDRALAPYRRIQLGLLAIGALAVVAGIAASAVLARTITAPVARLVQGTTQVARGDLDVTVTVDTSDELGDLAVSFNAMTRGLRERADMQKFMSQSTLEMIQSSGRRSSAEYRRLTLLFSDVRGFSGFAERHRPERSVEWLNRCLGMQAELVRKHRGDVDKFVGDGVFALFEGDDMAYRAVRSAVEIQRQMDELGAADDERLDLGIAIVTGEVLVGSIGSHDRSDYTAIGNQVNLCSRLCAMAEPREILMAASTYELVRDLVAAERLESVRVRGLAQPVDVYRLVIGARTG
jgi:class 3 adenylate cyclase